MFTFEWGGGEHYISQSYIIDSRAQVNHASRLRLPVEFWLRSLRFAGWVDLGSHLDLTSDLSAGWTWIPIPALPSAVASSRWVNLSSQLIIGLCCLT